MVKLNSENRFVFKCPDCSEVKKLIFNGRDEDENGEKTGILKFECTCGIRFKCDYKGEIVQQSRTRENKISLGGICL